jgi:hypothetical protein
MSSLIARLPARRLVYIDMNALRCLESNRAERDRVGYLKLWPISSDREYINSNCASEILLELFGLCALRRMYVPGARNGTHQPSFNANRASHSRPRKVAVRMANRTDYSGTSSGITLCF